MVHLPCNVVLLAAALGRHVLYSAARLCNAGLHDRRAPQRAARREHTGRDEKCAHGIDFVRHFLRRLARQLCSRTRVRRSHCRETRHSPVHDSEAEWERAGRQQSRAESPWRAATTRAPPSSRLRGGCTRCVVVCVGGRRAGLGSACLLSALRGQVEYAIEAISHAGSAVGILSTEGVVLAAEKKILSKVRHSQREVERALSVSGGAGRSTHLGLRRLVASAAAVLSPDVLCSACVRSGCGATGRLQTPTLGTDPSHRPPAAAGVQQDG